MRSFLRPTAAAFLCLAPLALFACDSNSSSGLPGDGGGGTGGGQDAAAMDVAPDLAPDLPPDLAPDLPPDGPPPVMCSPSSTSRGAVCGRITRSTALPIKAGDPRADGLGSMIVLPFDCNPFTRVPSYGACKGEPKAMGSAVSAMAVDLSKDGATFEYRLVDLLPGDVYLIPLFVEVDHKLEGGLRAGDTTVSAPAPKETVVAGSVAMHDITLDVMAREIQVAVTVDPALMPKGDKKGPLALLTWDMPPMMGSEPLGFATMLDAAPPTSISVVVFEPMDYFLTAILDDDNSSMNLMMGDAIYSPGDLARNTAVPATIGPTDVSVKASLVLDEIVK